MQAKKKKKTKMHALARFVLIQKPQKLLFLIITIIM